MFCPFGTARRVRLVWLAVADGSEKQQMIGSFHETCAHKYFARSGRSSAMVFFGQSWRGVMMAFCKAE